MIKCLLIENNQKKVVKVSSKNAEVVQHSDALKISRSIGRFLNSQTGSIDPNKSDLGGFNKSILDTLARITFTLPNVGQCRILPLSIKSSQTTQISSTDIVIDAQNKMIPYVVVAKEGNDYRPVGNEGASLVFFAVPFGEPFEDSKILDLHEYLYAKELVDKVKSIGYTAKYNHLPFLYVPYQNMSKFKNYLRSSSGQVSDILSGQTRLRNAESANESIEKSLSLKSVFSNVIKESNGNSLSADEISALYSTVPQNPNSQDAPLSFDENLFNAILASADEDDVFTSAKLPDDYDDSSPLPDASTGTSNVKPFVLFDKYGGILSYSLDNLSDGKIRYTEWIKDDNNGKWFLNVRSVLKSLGNEIGKTPEESIEAFNIDVTGNFQDSATKEHISEVLKQSFETIMVDNAGGSNSYAKAARIQKISKYYGIELPNQSELPSKEQKSLDTSSDVSSDVRDEDVEELRSEDFEEISDDEDFDETLDELSDEDYIELKNTFDKIDKANAIDKTKLVNMSSANLSQENSLGEFLNAYINKIKGDQDKISYEDFVNKVVLDKAFSNAVRHEVFYNDIISSKEVKTLIKNLFDSAESGSHLKEENHKIEFANSLSALIFSSVEERIFGNNIFEIKANSNELLLESFKALRLGISIGTFGLAVAGFIVGAPWFGAAFGTWSLITSIYDDRKYKKEIAKYKNNPDKYIRDYMTSGNFTDKMIDSSLAILIAKSAEAGDLEIFEGDFSFLSNRGANTSSKQSFNECKKNYSMLGEKEKEEIKEVYNNVYDKIKNNGYVSNNVFTHGNIRKVLNILFFGADDKYKLSEDAINFIKAKNVSGEESEFDFSADVNAIELEIIEKIKELVENETNFKNNTISFVNQMTKKRSARNAGFFSRQSDKRKRAFESLTNDLLKNLSRAVDTNDYRKIYGSENLLDESKSRLYKRKLVDILFENEAQRNQENQDMQSRQDREDPFTTTSVIAGATAMTALGCLITLRNAAEVFSTGARQVAGKWSITTEIPKFADGAPNFKVAALDFATKGIDALHKAFDLGEGKSVIFTFTNHSAYVETPKALTGIIVDTKTGIAKFLGHGDKIIEFAGPWLKNKGVIVDLKQGTAYLAKAAKNAYEISFESPLAQKSFNIAANKLAGSIHGPTVVEQAIQAAEASAEGLSPNSVLDHRIVSNTEFKEMGLKKVQAVLGKGNLQGLKQGGYEYSKMYDGKVAASAAEAGGGLMSFLPAIPGLAAIAHKLWRRSTKKEIDGGIFARGFFDMYKPSSVVICDFFFALLGINLVQSDAHMQATTQLSEPLTDDMFESSSHDDGANDHDSAVEPDLSGDIDVGEQDRGPSLESARRRHGKNLSIKDLLSESRELSDMWSDYWKRN